MTNPFHAQGPTPPEYYSNRKALLERFSRNVMGVAESNGRTRPNNFSIVGRWGIGKTSTLFKFRDMLENECKGAKAFCVFVGLKPAAFANSDTFFQYMLGAILREMAGQLPTNARMKNFVEEEVGKWHLSKLSFTPELEHRERAVAATTVRESLVRVWKRLEENGYGIAVIMLDDIHYAVEQGKGAILMDLRTDIQNLPMEGARFMFITTSPENLQPNIRDAAEPFTRLFEKHILEPFDIAGTREMILKPIKKDKPDLALDEAVISRIHEFTGGHPYFISLIMREIVDRKAEGRLTAREFDAIHPDLSAYLAAVKFDDDFEKASDAERTILLKMARARDELVSPSYIGPGGPKSLVRLVEKGLVIKMDRGRFKLYHKLFRDYLKRKKP